MRFFLLSINLLLFLCLNAQMRFRHLKVDDGLSQSSVNTVIKDNKGFYWIGTQYGLNKFDGKNIKTYYTQNTTQLADNFIISALQDSEGNLWFATRNNICRYSAEQDVFTTIITNQHSNKKTGHNAIFNLYKDDDGNICFVSGGKLYRIKKQFLKNNSSQIESIDLKLPTISISFIHNKYLYVLNKDSLFKFDYKSNTRIKKWKANTINKQENNSIFYSNNEVCILNNNRLYLFHNDSLMPLFDNKLSNEKINCVSKIKQHYYVGTDNGLFVFDASYQFVNHYQTNLENPHSLSENKVLSISETLDGIIWIGNANAGVNCYNPKTNVFNLIKVDANKPYVSFSCFVKNDSLLFSGTDNGIDEFIKSNNKWNYKDSYFKNHKVTSIKISPNSIYLIGTTKGFYVGKLNNLKELTLNNESPCVFDINTDTQNQILVSTIKGVFILSIDDFSVVKFINRKNEKINSNYVFNTTLDSKNNYYINNTAGSYLFDSDLTLKKNVFENYKYQSLSEIMITSMLETNAETLWFGSLGNGVYQLKNNQLKNINQTNGLGNNVVAALLPGSNQSVWASTNYGISYINETGNKIINFDKELTISSPEFITNAAFKNNDDLFFCSNSGIVAFDSKTVLNKKTQESFHLSISSINKNYTDSVKIKDSCIVLNPDDKVFSISFIVPSYQYYDKIKLNYQLSNFDAIWHSTFNNKTITYTNLDYGEYDLTVKASLEDINWEQTLRLKIIVKPPFWKTLWFILLCALFFLMLVVFSVWYISRVKLKKQLMQMQINQKVFEEKDRISKDLHDNIGSQISTLISGLDKITITKTTANAERLSDYARNTLSELRETIWALNTDTVDLQILKNKLEELVFELRTNYDSIELEFSFVFSTNHVLNTQQALSFYRIIQEAANNAIKHASCTKICINLGINANLLRATIIDNGKGFDTTLRKKGHYGLDNMNDRASKLSIDYQLQSKINHGTRIILSIILNDNNSNS